MIISKFQGEYRWLSNHVPCSITYDGHKFPTVEHAYVYSKTLVKEEQELFLAEMDNLSPGQAKRLGKSLTLRPDWELIKLDVMRDLTLRKYNILYYKDKLLATGDVEIVEGNNWGDTFWGKCNNIGENHLGKIIMETRDYYRRLRIEFAHHGVFV